MLKCSLYLVLLVLSGQSMHGHGGELDKAALLERGSYLATISGCHDCHTPGYSAGGGKAPREQWLIGDQLGWSGPWGTTYASNLRLRIGTMDLPTWKAYARKVVARPPMPYWVLNTMSDDDLTALWTFTHSLGAAGAPAPAALPPGVKASGPVVLFPAPPAGSDGAH